MRISRIAAVALGTASATGVGLFAAFGFALLELEEGQRALTGNSAAVGDVVRLESALRQWLLLSDLVYASGETYLIVGADAQGGLARELISNLERSPVAEELAGDFAELRDIIADNTGRLRRAADLPADSTHALDALVPEWDDQSARVVALVEWISKVITFNSQSAASAYDSRQRAFKISGVILLLAYLALVVGVWNWLRKGLVDPLRRITSAADAALRTGVSMEVVPEGPTEIRDLARSARELAHVLETKVAARTAALAQEVETRRKAEQQSAEARDRAEATSRAKTEFITKISHELRTPLTGLLGTAELLGATGLDERQRLYTRTIKQSGEALLTLVNDVLDLAKIGSGKAQLSEGTFDLEALVEDSIDLCAEAAHRKGLELIGDVQVEPGMAYRGDRLRLQQVLVNLLGNAVKFTVRGHIRVSVTVERLHSKSAQVRFAVEDTGVGLTPLERATIFEEFSRADSPQSRRFGSIGLGLSICKQLIALMNGTIGVESTVGLGSTFWFVVELAPVGESHVSTGEVFAGRHVLIIDAEERSRALLCKRLQALGVVVQEAGDAQTALRATGELSTTPNLFDAVIVDPTFDRGDSEAAQRIMERLLVGEVPVIALTPLRADSGRAVVRSSDHAIQLAKPVRRGWLVQALREAFAAHDRSAMGVQESPAAVRSSPAALDTGLLVLLVEDDEVNRMVAGAMLEQIGCRIEFAGDGHAAIAALRDKTFDLVLMDCQMPGLDGLEATRRIRLQEQSEGRPAVRIVAVTANAMTGDREACFAAGMNDYLTKPFTMSQLNKVLLDCADVAREPGLASRTSAKAASTDAGAPVDAATLGALRALPGTDGGSLLARLIDLYLKSSSELMETARLSAALADGGQLGKAAHTLKSSSANVGALRLASLCAEVEANARRGDVAAAGALLDSVTDEHARVVAALRALPEAEAA
jgi:signal transduction histidine kinase/CheY-like chemotaxis protein